MPQVNTCRGCDNTWPISSAGACHCAACHVTFTQFYGFAKHRFKGGCRTVEEMVNDHGYAFIRAGMLGIPGKKEEEE